MLVLMIGTKRFILKPLSVDHATERYAEWLTDPDSKRYIVTASDNSLSYLRNYIKERSERADVLFLGIFVRETNDHIGNIKFEPINTLQKSAVCGILIGEMNWRGKGVAREVIRAACQRLLEEKGVTKYFLGVDPHNTAAVRAYKKIGFQQYDIDTKGNLKMLLDLNQNHNLALGTVQFGMNYGIANQAGRVPPEEVKKILAFAGEQGIDTLDTATGYGESERVLGMSPLERWKVITKIGSVPIKCDDINSWIFDQIHGSLGRLGISALHGLLLHNPGQLLEPFGNQIISALKEAQQRGLIRHFGVSIYDPAELDQLTRVCEPTIVQAPFSILDRRMIESGWLDRLSGMNVEVHVRSIYLQGLLLMNGAERPQRFERWNPLWSAWRDWLQEAALTPLQACTRYALSFPQISKVFVGTDRLRQLMDIQ
jgi:aryl-alcohol dehydrogenase-like predicted oxidoreductase/RimJ/RimL family protein N-acetyltransferase